MEGMNPYAHGLRLRNREDFFPQGYTNEQLERVYFRLTSGRLSEYSILESPTFEEVDDFYNPGEYEVDADFVVEAVVVDKFSRTEQRMKALSRALGKYLGEVDGESISPMAPLVGKPKKAGSFAYVTVQIPFSDGQTISIVFHSPEGDKKRIGPEDQIIAFRWLLNKRDITHVVAPEEGQEVSLETIGKRISQLVSKNHAHFIATQKDAVEQQKKLDGLKVQAEALDTENAMLAQTLTGNETELAKSKTQINSTTTKIEQQKAYNAKLVAEIDALKAKKASKETAGTGGGYELSSGEKQALQESDVTQYANDDFKKAGGYAAIFADDEKQKQLQDSLDAIFQNRIVSIRNVLRERGWSGGENGTALQKVGMTLGYGVKAIGAGKNVVGVEFILSGGGRTERFRDMLDMGSIPFAIMIDNAAMGGDDSNQQGQNKDDTEESWKLPADQIKAMPADEYQALYNKLEDKNFHAENNLLHIKRNGNLLDVQQAETIYAEQEAAGYLTPEIDKKWGDLKDRMASEKTEPVKVYQDDGSGYTYTAYKVNLDGALSDRANLNSGAELNQWMDSVYGKFANVRVIRDQDGKEVNYTDNGTEFVRVDKPVDSTPSVLAPAPEQNGNPAKRAAKILYYHGLQERAMGAEDFIVRIEPKEGPNLVIDKAGMNLSVQHLEKRNGKVLVDQSVSFALNQDGTLDLDSTAIQGPNGMIRGKDITIAQAFTKSLIDQGLAKSGVLKEGRGLVDDEVGVPDGWTEAFTGGMMTNIDPLAGGIIDKEIVSGKWFVIPNNENLEKMTDFNTRDEVYQAFMNAVQNKVAPSSEGAKQEIKPPAEMDMTELLPYVKKVKPFLGNAQLQVMANGLRGEEKGYFKEKFVEMANIIETMPKTYEQDGKGNDAVVYLHYFTPSGNFYITERDEEESQDQAFGLVELSSGYPELGYISINEITGAGAELDLHWTQKTLREVKGISSPDKQEEVNIEPQVIDAPEPSFVTKLESILSGQYDGNLEDLETRFEEALTEAEQAGKDAEYADLIEKVSEYYTQKLSEKAQEVK